MALKLVVFLQKCIKKNIWGRIGAIDIQLNFPEVKRHHWEEFNFTLHTLHSTLHTVRSTLHTLHSSLHTLHFSLHTLHSTLYIPHFTLYTWHSTLYTPHSTLHTPHLYTPHSTLHTPPHITLYTLLTPHSSLHTPHFTLYTPHSTLHTSHCTLYTLHSTLYTPYFALQTLHSTLSTPPSSIYFHIPQSTVHWYGNRGKMHKTVEINCFRKVFCVTAYTCVSASVPLTYVWAFGCVGCILFFSVLWQSRSLLKLTYLPTSGERTRAMLI